MKKKPSVRQLKLIELLKKNALDLDSTDTLRELLAKAGYSKASQHNPHLIIDNETIREGVKEFTIQLRRKAWNALNNISDSKLKKSSAKDNATILDILTKNAQLLSGGATSHNITIEISKEVADKYLNKPKDE